MTSESSIFVNAGRVGRGLWWEQALSLVEGCTHVDTSCSRCWSAEQTRTRQYQKNEKIRARYCDLISDGHWNGEVRLMVDDLAKPYNKKRPTLFAVWNDLFHEGVPFTFQQQAVRMMVHNNHHRFIVLTKRELMLRDFLARYNSTRFRNVGFGVSVCTNEGIERLRVLRGLRFGVRVVSFEPLLERLKIPDELLMELTWAFIGGESDSLGLRGRQCESWWIAELVAQLHRLGVKVFVKQLGSWWARQHPIDRNKPSVYRIGDRKASKMEHWPAAVRVREFPEVFK